MRTRRRLNGLRDLDETGGEPSVRKGLVGLAFSGGGIRSASVCLGVVQRIAKAGLFRYVDYLSTVSGGGYTGACVSSLLSDPERPPDAPFPLRSVDGEPEPPALQHLRNGSKFLTPGGFLEKVRLPVMIGRGTVLSFLVFLPLVMLAVVATELVYESDVTIRDLIWLIPVEGVILFLLIATVPFVGRLIGTRIDWSVRNRYQLILAGGAVVLVATLALVPVSHLVEAAIETPWDAARQAFPSPEFLEAFHIPRYWLWLGPLVLLSGIVLMSRASGLTASLADRMVLYLIGLLGPGFIALVYLAFCVFQVDTPYIARSFGPEFERMAAAPDSLHLAPDLLTSAFHNRGIELDSWIRADHVPSHRHHGAEVEIASEWLLVSHADSLAGTPGIEHHVAVVGDSRLMILETPMVIFDLEEDGYFFLTLGLMILFNIFLMDVNTASLHGYYRDRLSRAFLIREDDGGTEVAANDTLRLSRLGPAAPYHLVNAAVNLQGSRDHSLRGRMADFFVMSRRYVGSERTGYARTEEIEEVDTHLDLAAAVAISGAAASPNMGSSTQRTLTFVMTLLNLRLGYWLINPLKFSAQSFMGTFLRRAAGPALLLKEAVGNLNERGRFVNLSDGGHIENLGVYELLRRRCRVIIAMDAGADPNFQFGDLVRLMRYAEIDMGITVDIDVDALRPDSDGKSGAHAVLGRIDYGSDGSGILVYMKSTVTGDEGEFLRHYRTHSPAFPHQSTADQFFGEEDMEAYRALGFHVCEYALENLASVLPEEVSDEPVVRAWVQGSAT